MVALHCTGCLSNDMDHFYAFTHGACDAVQGAEFAFIGSKPAAFLGESGGHTDAVCGND